MIKLEFKDTWPRSPLFKEIGIYKNEDIAFKAMFDYIEKCGLKKVPYVKGTGDIKTNGMMIKFNNHDQLFKMKVI